MINSSTFSSETLAGKIVRLPLRAVPRGIAVPILRGPLRGQKWVVGSFLHRCWLGSYELEFQQLLVEKIKPGGVFYDVGANVGFYSLLAAKYISPGKVYSFEPLRANLLYLHKHVEMNHVRNVQILEVAVSDQDGVASFAAEASRGMGHLQSGGNVTVPTATLDHLVREQQIAPPNYIKMDIEGGEFDALKGAARSFSQYSPVLFLATHGVEIHKRCSELLESWNYELQLIRQSSPDRAELMARPRS